MWRLPLPWQLPQQQLLNIFWQINVREKQAHRQFSFLALFFKFSACCENEIFKTLGKKTIQCKNLQAITASLYHNAIRGIFNQMIIVTWAVGTIIFLIFLFRMELYLRVVASSLAVCLFTTNVVIESIMVKFKTRMARIIQ